MKFFKGAASLFNHALMYLTRLSQPHAELSAVLSHQLEGWDNRHQIQQVFRLDSSGRYIAVTEQGQRFSCKPKSSTFMRTTDMIGFYKGQAFIWLLKKAESENANNILSDAQHFLNEINELLDKESLKSAEEQKSEEERFIEAQASWVQVREKAITLVNFKGVS